MDKSAPIRQIATMVGANQLAILHYGTPDYRVVRGGDHVLCAVTGQRIPLTKLAYWSVAHQEAYAGPEEAVRAERAGGARKLAKAAAAGA